MNDSQADPIPADQSPEGQEVITLGAGCFWCVEAVLARIDGVDSAVSGYMGGETENPTYQEICTGNTGHAEVVRASYDPDTISTEQVIRLFFELHDPTQLNRQGPDVGTQYRSAIFYHTDEQRQVAESVMAELSEADRYSDPIVTEITAADTFYPAEEYHQDYWETEAGQNSRYCRALIPSKLEKLGLQVAPIETPDE